MHTGVVHPLPLPVRRLWRGVAVVSGVAVLFGLGALDLILRASDVTPPWPPLVVPALTAIVVAIAGLAVAEARYRTWRYRLDEHSVAARWGVLNHHSAVVPRNRVQTVTTSDGPADRFLGLTTLTVHTAGALAPNLTIPHLDDETVDWLRRELAGGSI